MADHNIGRGAWQERESAKAARSAAQEVIALNNLGIAFCEAGRLAEVRLIGALHLAVHLPFACAALIPFDCPVVS